MEQLINRRGKLGRQGELGVSSGDEGELGKQGEIENSPVSCLLCS